MFFSPLRIILLGFGLSFASPLLRADPSQDLATKIQFLKRLRENLQSAEITSPLKAPGAILGRQSSGGLALDESLLAVFAATLEEFHPDLSQKTFNEKKSWADFFFKLPAAAFVRVADGISQYPSRPTLEMEAGLVGLIRFYGMGLWELAKEVPPRTLAWVWRGSRRHGPLYWTGVPFVAGVLVGVEHIEHHVLQLPHGTFCTKIPGFLFAAYASVLIPVSSLCSIFGTNTEDQDISERIKIFPKHLHRALRLVWEDVSVHQKLKVVSMEDVIRRQPIFRRSEISKLDFSGDAILEKVSGHPLFWPALYLLMHKSELPTGPDLTSANRIATTLSDQLRTALDLSDADESQRFMHRLQNKMRLHQQLSLFHWMLEGHTELIDTFQEAQRFHPYLDQIPLFGRLGDIEKALADYKSIMNFLIDYPDRIKNPTERLAQMNEIIFGGILKSFEHLDKIYAVKNENELSWVKEEMREHAGHLQNRLRYLRTGLASGACWRGFPE